MTLDREDILLGLNFSGNNLRAVEAEKREGLVHLITVAESRMEAPFDFSAIGAEEYISQFANNINSLVDRAGIRAKSARFALERRMVLLKRLVVDHEISDVELRQQVEWELEQLLVAPRDEYNVGFERIGPVSDKFDGVIIVAVRKAIIQYLKEIFNQTPLNLTVVDVDTFAAIRALWGDIDNSAQVLAVLIDFNKKGLFFTLVENGKYFLSSEVTASQQEGVDISHLNANSEEMAGFIADELSRLLQSAGNTYDPANIQNIFVAGENVDVEVISYLKERFNTAAVALADPFSNVRQRLDAESESLTKEKPEKFLAAVGMVLS